MYTYWQRQTDEPLFPDILWSRPETKKQAGSLLIIGGNSNQFSSLSQAQTIAEAAGVGSTNLVLPKSLKRAVGEQANIYYVEITSGGGISKELVEVIQPILKSTDGVLFSGDAGRSSETTAAILDLIANFSKPIILTKDSIDLFYHSPKDILDHQNVCLVISSSQLAKLASASGTNLSNQVGLVQYVEKLHDYSESVKATLVTSVEGSMLVANNGNIVSQKVGDKEALWQLKTAARAAVFYLQGPTTPLEAISTSLN